MRGERVLFIGGRGPVSAPALRTLAPDNDVWALATFSVPADRRRLESLGVTCIRHDIVDPVDGLPADIDYVFYTALPKRQPAPGLRMTTMPPCGTWPYCYDAYAEATGRLMAHFHKAQGFLFASTISVYEPVGGEAPVPETAPFGIHATAFYAFTKVARRLSQVSYLTYICYTYIAGCRQLLPGGPLVFSRLGASMTARTVAGKESAVAQ